MTNEIELNARDLEQELQWFSQVLDTGFSLYFQQEVETKNVFDLTSPDLSGSTSRYAQVVNRFQMSFAERLCLLMALIPHIRPQILDVFLTKNTLYDRRYTEFGGEIAHPAGNFIPTGETLAFLLGGQDLKIRFTLGAMLDRDHFFTKSNILQLEVPVAGHSVLKAPLRLSEEYSHYLTFGATLPTRFGSDFPAHTIDTQQGWDDLVLDAYTMKEVRTIQDWMQHGQTLSKDWGMANKVRPGYRALFHGAPGTGKTMTVCLLGKSVGQEVCRVDCSLLVSGYIGETEKNLSRIFDLANYKNWILYFDEADALFGRRSEVKDAGDRTAPAILSFLLHCLESFKGVAILALDTKDHIDQTLLRRFESVLYFSMPGPEERLQLWKNGLPAEANVDPGIDLPELARRYELTGGTIMNVIRYASLQAIGRKGKKMIMSDIIQGVRQEYRKEGQPINK